MVAVNTALLNAVTTATSGSAFQQVMPFLNQSQFLLTVTAQGNFHATITVATSPSSGGVYTPIKTWDINGQNNYADNFSYNVPYDYYVQATVNTITGLTTTVNLTYVTNEAVVPAVTLTASQTGIPIAIPAGNGSTVGLQFTNTTGAFSLTTAVFTTIYAGIWLWMPIGAFDGTNPTVANYYWAAMSSTSVGQLYTSTYQMGVPTGLVAATTASAHWITQTTGADITLQDIAIPGGSLGPNGMLANDIFVTYNNSAGAKTIKTKLGATTLFSLAPTTTTTLLATTNLQNRGAQNSQVSDAVAGYGASTTALIYSAVDTSVLQTYSITGQLAANTDFIVLENQFTQTIYA